MDLTPGSNDIRRARECVRVPKGVVTNALLSVFFLRLKAPTAHRRRRAAWRRFWKPSMRRCLDNVYPTNPLGRAVPLCGQRSINPR